MAGAELPQRFKGIWERLGRDVLERSFCGLSEPLCCAELSLREGLHTATVVFQTASQAKQTFET